MPLTGATRNFLINPIGFMQTNSVVPPHEREIKVTYEAPPEGGVGRTANYDPGFDVRGTDIPTDGMFGQFFDDSKVVDRDKMVTGTYKTAEVTAPVGHMKFKDSIQYPGAHEFDVKNEAADDALPIWFLPWKSDKIVRMRIPPKPRRYTAAQSPMIFFTAAINGCSVFATGGVMNPILAHAGTEDTTPYGDDAKSFWRTLFEVSLGDTDTGPIGEVNRSQYVKDTQFKNDRTTVNALAYKRWLHDNLGPRRKVQQVRPFGCVFGVRNHAGVWSFYLQENATVTTARCVRERRDITVQREVEKRTLFGKKRELREVTEEADVWLEVESTTTKPMRVSKFYPNGPGRVATPTTFHMV